MTQKQACLLVHAKAMIVEHCETSIGTSKAVIGLTTQQTVLKKAVLLLDFVMQLQLVQVFLHGTGALKAELPWATQCQTQTAPPHAVLARLHTRDTALNVVAFGTAFSKPALAVSICCG